MSIQDYLTKQNLAITGGVVLTLAAGFGLGRFTSGSKAETPKKVEVLTLGNYELVRQDKYLFGIDNDNNLRVVQAVEGQDPFALVNRKSYNIDLNKTNETEDMSVSGLEVKLTAPTRTATVQVRKK